MPLEIFDQLPELTAEADRNLSALGCEEPVYYAGIAAALLTKYKFPGVEHFTTVEAWEQMLWCRIAFSRDITPVDCVAMVAKAFPAPFFAVESDTLGGIPLAEALAAHKMSEKDYRKLSRLHQRIYKHMPVPTALVLP